MKAENILIAIAQENGFDTWEQYFECFRTTDAGRREINKSILKAVNQALILSSVVEQSEQLVCSCGSRLVKTTGGYHCGNAKCSV